MKALRSKTMLATIGTLSIVATLAGNASATAATTSPSGARHSNPADDSDDSDACEGTSLATSSVNVAKAANDRAVRARAAAERRERQARAAVKAARTGTPSQQRAAQARYTRAHDAAAKAGRQARRASAALTEARRRAAAAAQSACGVPAPTVPTPPTPTPPVNPTPAPGTSTGTSAPATPSGLAVHDAGSHLANGAMELSWTAVTGATRYTVYRDGSSIGSVTAAATTLAAPPAGYHSYSVTASNATGTSSVSAAVSAGEFTGTAFNDQLGRTVYGQIQVSLVVTSGAVKTITGCWATYPTGGDSGAINSGAIPALCGQVLTKQPISSNATSLITSISGASASSPAFKSSLQNALTKAGK